MTWKPAVIGLGSNLGDRRALIMAAVASLRRVPGVRVGRVSRLSRTAPVGQRRQPWFLNGAVLVATRLHPSELLARLKRIERDLGRVRYAGGPRFGPRTIDLDLLLHGVRVVRMPFLTLPHPRFHERAFALEPAAAIAGGLVHPVAGVTLRCLLRRLRGKP